MVVEGNTYSYARFGIFRMVDFRYIKQGAVNGGDY